jgi:hypothetical protein
METQRKFNTHDVVRDTKLQKYCSYREGLVVDYDADRDRYQVFWPDKKTWVRASALTLVKRAKDPLEVPPGWTYEPLPVI